MNKENQTVAAFLKKKMPEISSRKLKNLFSSKRVLINEKICLSPQTELGLDDTVSIRPKEKRLPLGIKILYEDAHLVVIDKPAGLLSVATNQEKELTAHKILKNRKRKIVYPVHRLDRDTSGLMIFAYTPLARDCFKEFFYTHKVEREYRAIVEGVIANDQGSWESYLAEDRSFYVRSVKNPKKGKRAKTIYFVLKRKQNKTVLRIVLETGRKNQIRVHCAEAGHPVIGDKKYGSKQNHRLCLHAYHLRFIHPVLQKMMQFTSPLPVGFE